MSGSDGITIELVPEATGEAQALLAWIEQTTRGGG
jgi:hypothetical protein